MRYRITHTTRYAGSEPISVGHNEARLTPRNTHSQHCLRHHLEIKPEPSIRSGRLDYYGNSVTRFSFNQGYEALSVTAVSEVDVGPPPLPNRPSPPWEMVLSALGAHRSVEDLAAYEFVFDSPRCRTRAEFAEYARESFLPGRPILESGMDLMRRIHADFRFDPTSTTVSTPVEQVFKQRRGVCQDFAHLMISMMRSLGLAARYVSGYLRTIPPPGRPRLVGADASHAWSSLFCGPVLGWIDLDPTTNLVPGPDHVTVAWGRDYGDIAPLKGVFVGGGSPQLFVGVDVCELTRDDPGDLRFA